MDKYNLPFKVGQLAEARSFVSGYRGAWFRCKIKEIGRKKGVAGHAVEYYDFPDEKVRWTKLYQKRSSKSKDLTLMIRPHFPPVYHEGESFDINSISEVSVILNDVWKVGDLVDWWSDGCYWSGRLTKVLGPEKFQIELFPPPFGEGLSYEASCKDLRPSLDWSSQHGWTVPVITGSEDCRSCGRIVKPVNQGSSAKVTIHEERKECDASVSSGISTSRLPPPDRAKLLGKSLLSKTACMETQPMKSTTSCMETQPVESTTACAETQPMESSTACMKTQPVKSTAACVDIQAVEKNKSLHVTDDGIAKTSCSDSISSLRFGVASAEVAGDTAEKDSHHNRGPSKKMRTDRSIMLNSMSCDTIEAAIVHLEELVNRVKWMKDILKFGMPLPDSVQPSWKFVEHRSSSLQK
eukprot:XP_015578900.1 uncharacterized protein LOC8276931 isoform X2 [Ricinus communis]